MKAQAGFSLKTIGVTVGSENGHGKRNEPSPREEGCLAFTLVIPACFVLGKGGMIEFQSLKALLTP